MIVARQLGQERKVVPDTAGRVFHEAPRDALDELVAQVQRGAETGDQTMDGLGERQRVGDRADEGVVSAVEHRVEPLRRHRDTLGPTEPIHPLLPRQGTVQRAAEVEQNGGQLLPNPRSFRGACGTHQTLIFSRKRWTRDDPSRDAGGRPAPMSSYRSAPETGENSGVESPQREDLPLT